MEMTTTVEAEQAREHLRASMNPENNNTALARLTAIIDAAHDHAAVRDVVAFEFAETIVQRLVELTTNRGAWLPATVSSTEYMFVAHLVHLLGNAAYGSMEHQDAIAKARGYALRHVLILHVAERPPGDRLGMSCIVTLSMILSRSYASMVAVSAAHGLMPAVAYFMANFNMRMPLRTTPLGSSSHLPQSDHPWGFAIAVIANLLSLHQLEHYTEFIQNQRRRLTLEEPQLVQAAPPLTDDTLDAVMGVYLKCQALLASPAVARLTTGAIFQIMCLINAVALLPLPSPQQRVEWLVTTCVLTGHGRGVDLHTLYMRIIQGTHGHLDLTPEDRSRVAGLAKRFFVRLYPIVVNAEMVAAADTCHPDTNRFFCQLYTRFVQQDAHVFGGATRPSNSA